MPKRLTEKTRRRWPLYVHASDGSVVYRARKKSAGGVYEVATLEGAEVGPVGADLFETTYRRLHPRRKTGG